MTTRGASCILALFVAASNCWAESNWPQFRGPGGLATAPGSPPIEFSPDPGHPKNLRWAAAIPTGHSSPIIWEDKIILTGLDAGKLVTLCLSRADGHELWRAIAPAQKIEPAHRIGSPAAPTPCADATRIHVYFGSYGVITYNWLGQEVWKKPLPPPVVEFGTGSSPILAAGKLIVLADQDVGSYLLALDPATGKELWRVQRPEFRRGFSTPFLWQHPEDPALEPELVVAGSLQVRSYDLKTGAQLWTARGMARVSNATPISAGPLLLLSSWNVGGDESDRVEMEPFEAFAAAHDADHDGKLVINEFPKGPVKDRFSQIDANKDGFVTKEEYEIMRSMFAQATNQMFAIRPGGHGDITETHVAWRIEKQLPYVSSPTVANGRVFAMKNGGLLSCYDATSGSPIYTAERVDAPGDYYSSGLTTPGRLYVTSQRGTVVVIDTTADTLRVLSRNDLKEPVFATPAVIGNTLYLRGDKHLFAFGEQ